MYTTTANIPMTKPFFADNCRISLEKKGSPCYTKMSFPVHCGVFSELETNSFVFHFNLNGEIIRAKAKGGTWAHPHEWLKRTRGNDWVYYSTGGYSGVFEATGEYYLPNFDYPTNNLLGGHPFTLGEINCVKQSWHEKLIQLTENLQQCTNQVNSFLEEAIVNTPSVLATKADELRAIIGGRISVLPPDARHVDYNLVPLTISQGCLYKCRFCKVKNTVPFTEKTRAEISDQIIQLKKLYARDLANYNAFFLGEHDALQASPELICFAIEEAYREFDFAHSNIKDNKTFLFGSVTSLLNAPEHLFQDLNVLPGTTYINIGLESADQETLTHIGKPITVRQVHDAFARMQEINDRYSEIEKSHRRRDNGLPVYFSPLTFGQPSRARLFEFNRLKIQSRLPTFLYIIQRL